MQFIDLNEQAVVSLDKIVAIGRADSAGARRLIAELAETDIVDLTGGERRRAFILFESGQLVLTHLSVTSIRGMISQTLSRQPRHQKGATQ